MLRRRLHSLCIVAGVLLVLAAVQPAAAFDGRSQRDQRGGPVPANAYSVAQSSCQDMARSALQQGQALPFGQIKRLVEGQFGGQVVEVGCSGGRNLVYHLKVVQRNGQVRRVAVLAANGQIIGVR
jgi:uncharacterized membrane protein YkoI